MKLAIKLVIGGGARCGKSTLADHLAHEHGLPVYRADDLAHLGWSEASDAFADVIAFGRDGIYEGVAAVRALRKLLRRSRERPCTRYVHLSQPYERLTPGQQRMSAAVETIRREVVPRLRARQVQLRCGNPCDALAPLLELR